jgi:hypothetical protein
MTTTQRLKDSLVSYLDTNKPDAAISVVDSKQRADVNLPTLAVEVGSAEAHSVTLSHIQNCSVEFKLRTHAGDESDYDIDSWIDTIETLLCSPEAVKTATLADVQMDHWVYNGSEQEWDESTLEVSFEANCLVSRV